MTGLWEAEPPRPSYAREPYFTAPACRSASAARCRYTLRAASNCSSTCSRSFGERQDVGLSAIFHSLSSQVRKYSADLRLLIFCSPTYTRTGFETACGKDGSEERALRCPSAVNEYQALSVT